MKDYTYKFTEEIEVPDIVTEKINSALSMIQEESTETTLTVRSKSHKKWTKKKIFVLSFAAALAAGTITAAATLYHNWSRGMQEGLQVSEKQMIELEDTGMSSFIDTSVPEATCTDAGITLTAQQSITDSSYAYISIKVEGYQVEKGIQPAFEKATYRIDDGEEQYTIGIFYDGVICGPDGFAVNADGTPIEDWALDYMMEDGTLEYQVTLPRCKEKNAYIGKHIHMDFENLGSVAKAAYEPDVTGHWSLDFDLGGSDSAKINEMDEPLGDTGATVKYLEISPISILAKYDFPRVKAEERIPLENGEEQIITYDKSAPWPTGVKMKDGTIVNYINAGAGNNFYTSPDSDEYQIQFMFDRVIDIENVESVLFAKEDLIPIPGVIPTEDDFYSVGLN